MEFVMKIFKAFIIALFSLLLTGCYTQLQYSQTMREITDEEKKERTGYTWTEGTEASQQTRAKDEPVAAGQDYVDSTDVEQYIPIDYKDYQYAEKYDACECNPYNVYNFYGDYYEGYGYTRPYSSFGTYLSISPFSYPRWRYRSYYGYRYHPSFAISFSWGSPHYYHSFFHDPFFDPYYDSYWYGRGYLSYTYWKFYGNYGAGYYYDNDRRDRNTRYAPRSIGTNRIGNRSDTRSRNAGLSGRTGIQNKQTVRTRSLGTSRIQATTNRSRGTTVNRTRSKTDTGNSGTSRSRSRSGENLQGSSDVYIDRTNEKSRPVYIDLQQYNAMRARIANQNRRTTILNDRITTRDRPQMAPTVDANKRLERKRPTFFERMKSFFENNSVKFINSRTDNRAIRSRSGTTNRSAVTRGNGSSNRSSVTKSRSSSSNSRSTGSSSRSRSGGSSSSGSDRNRGGN
jgi:hypothetical protein